MLTFLKEKCEPKKLENIGDEGEGPVNKNQNAFCYFVEQDILLESTKRAQKRVWLEPYSTCLSSYCHLSLKGRKNEFKYHEW